MLFSPDSRAGIMQRDGAGHGAAAVVCGLHGNGDGGQREQERPSGDRKGLEQGLV